MRRSPTPGAWPDPLQPVLERPCHESAQAAASRAGVGPDAPHQPDGQLDGEHHGRLRDRHPLRMVLSYVDISPGLPQGHLVALGKAPQVLVSAPRALMATFTASSIGSLKGTSIRSRPCSWVASALLGFTCQAKASAETYSISLAGAVRWMLSSRIFTSMVSVGAPGMANSTTSLWFSPSAYATVLGAVLPSRVRHEWAYPAEAGGVGPPLVGHCRRPDSSSPPVSRMPQRWRRASTVARSRSSGGPWAIIATSLRRAGWAFGSLTVSAAAPRDGSRRKHTRVTCRARCPRPRGARLPPG